MRVQLIFILTHVVTECITVHAPHDMLCLPSTHVHDIGVRNAYRVGYTYVVMPEVMQSEAVGEARGQHGSPESLGQLSWVDRHDPVLTPSHVYLLYHEVGI